MEMNLILAKHLAGTSSPEEEAEVLAWLSGHPSRMAHLERLRDAWAMVGGTPGWSPPGDPEAASERYGSPAEAWARVLDGAGGAPEAEAAPERASVATSPRRTAGGLTSALFTKGQRIATACVALALITAVTQLVRSSILADASADLRTYVTGAGERKSLLLADGSRVMIGPESEIRVGRSFGRRGRVVGLSGTAFFDVAPDGGRPFEVHAGGTITRVLGTRFAVRAYSDEDAVEVAVQEGRVVLGGRRPGGEVTLTRGEVGEMGPRGIGQRSNGANPDRLLAWTRGRLVFRDLPLADIAHELERWYGVEIRITDPELARRRVTLSFAAAELDSLLELIGSTVGAEVERSGRVATLSPAPEG